MKHKNIIICSNVAGAGKDTAAEYFVERGYLQLSFADPIYEIARDLFNMKEKNRKLLQQIGEKMRDIDYDVWAKKAFSTAERWNEIFNAPVVISDMRRDNEYQFGIEAGFIPFRIVTDRNTAIQRIILRDGHCDVTLLDNDSEIGTRNIVMLEITNNGTTLDLYKKLDNVFETMLLNK